jgi:SET domain-containing protein
MLYEERASDIEGIGCFALRYITAGTVVDHWTGERVSTADLLRIERDGLYHSSAAIGEDEHLLFKVVDPSEFGTDLAIGSGTRGFNHSCDSNLWLEAAFTVIARRDIGAGEELTIDYALFSAGPDWRMECNCGLPVCRRTVTGEDWRMSDVQRRYKGHFSPFINERIARLVSHDPKV